ncbi:MAG: serine protease AprX [Actinomycetota bacterium]|nr:serine protease AprX [Actinomycetota bacterium]
MLSSCSSPLRSSRRPGNWRVAAAVALAVAVALPAGASTTARTDAPAVGPTVRQIAWWADGSAATLDALAARLRASGASVVGRLSVASGVVVEVPSTWQPPTGVMSAADRPMRVTGDAAAGASGDQGSDDSRRGPDSGASGRGVTVAVVDTGVASVPDLPGSVQHLNVSGAAAGDGFGHGTFLAGLIASSGVSSGGRYRGIAPDAGILDVQVAAPDGSTSLLRVLAGLQAVAERARRDDSLRVVNLSLSADDPGSPGIDPLSRALEGLWDRGLVVVVAAGNDGPEPGTVTVPGTDPAVITVGALDDKGTVTPSDDVVAPFSSRGTVGDPSPKPDLVAPGVATVGLRAPGSVIDTKYPAARVGAANFRGSGTSMATAVVSGAVAALLSTQPELGPDDVKAALSAGAYAVSGDRTATGAGGLDLAATVPAAAQIRAQQQAWSAPAVSATYQRFAAAWRKGSRSDALAAWLQLPAGLRSRLAGAWASAVAAGVVASYDQADAARRWATDGDLGAVWLSRSWASRSWAADDWASRSWASRSWASRSWAADDWASRSWASRSWASRSWASRSWASRSWAADDWGPRSP